MNLYDEFGRTSKECTPFFPSKMFTKICTTERKKLTLHIQRYFKLAVVIVGSGHWLAKTTNEPSTKRFKSMKKRSLSAVVALLLCVVGATAQIKQSSGDEEHWYYLLSANSGAESQAIVENTNSETSAKHPLITATLDQNDEAQQWKFVKNETSNNLFIVNRKSGKQIIASSVASGRFNITQLGIDTEHKGFKLEEIADGQFTISGVEEDNIRRYLALRNPLLSDIPKFETKDLKNSVYAWVAVQAGSKIYNTEADVTIKVKNRRIIVENAQDYRVTNLAGVQFPKKAILDQGIYVVTIGNASTNVYVK